MSGQSGSGVQGASNSCPAPSASLPTVSITATDPGFRTMKVTWEWSSTNVNITELKIKYHQKSGCPPITGCTPKYIKLKSPFPTSYIFKGTKDDATGLRRNAEYEFRIEAKIDVAGASFNVSSDARREDTYAARKVVPQVNQEYGGTVSPPVNLKDQLWEVMMSTRVDFSLPWSGEKQSRYEFALSVPRGTGLQIKYPPVGHSDEFHAACAWSGWPSTTSRWVRVNVTLHLVRCGIGDGVSSIKVKVRNTEHNYEWEMDDHIVVEKSWHKQANVVGYRLWSLPTDTTLEAFSPPIATAAAGWNGERTGLQYCNTEENDCRDGTGDGTILYILHYNPENAVNQHCLDSIACNTYRRPGYPHRGDQKLYIEQPPYSGIAENEEGEDEDPRTHKGKDKGMWSTHATRANDDEYHLTSVLMHEMGHAGALGHSFAHSYVSEKKTYTDVMGGIRLGQIKLTPTTYDTNAMKSIYQSHSAHR